MKLLIVVTAFLLLNVVHMTTSRSTGSQDKMELSTTTNKNINNSTTGRKLITAVDNNNENVNTTRGKPKPSLILPEWGGTCTKKDWDKCSHLDKWVTSYYVDVNRPELGFKVREIICSRQPVLCLKNGWTVTRCQLLCMNCNHELLSKYNKYVAKEGPC